MNIFTEPARRQICRTVASMANGVGDVAEFDFLSDNDIWKECWFLLVTALIRKEQMVSPKFDSDTPLPLVAEKLKSAFDTFSREEVLFDDVARAHLAMLPNNEGVRYRVDEQSKVLQVRTEGDSKASLYESDDISLWYSLFDVAVSGIRFGDNDGFWLRNCFDYVKKHGSLPDILFFEEEFE